jgi:hypothetical protein
MGLRLMSTALMGTRANVLGGIHFHRLLCFPTGNIATPHRMAELAIQKLTRPSQAKFLYFVLTMDVLFFDEIGQLSAQQIDALDIILRTLRNTDIPFGGVHVFGEYCVSAKKQRQTHWLTPPSFRESSINGPRTNQSHTWLAVSSLDTRTVRLRLD